MKPTTDLKERVMSIINSKTDEELREEFKHLDEQMEAEDRESRKKTFVSWIVSGAMHATVLMLLCTITFMSMDEKDVELPPVRVSIVDNHKFIEPPVKVIKDTIREDIELDIDHEVTNDKTIISSVDMPVEISTTEDEIVSKDTKGREEAVSDSELGGSGAFSLIGAGSGGKGMFGKRIGGGDSRTIGQAFGPHSRGVKTSLDLALRWLKKHQSLDGSWSAVKYNQNCLEAGPKCEPGKGAEGGDEAMTGYATLCFLGAGYDHKTPSKYRDVAKKGLTWILAHQKPDGSIGTRNYENPIAGMALIEAYGMSNDTELRIPAQKVVDFILSKQAQNPKATDKAYATIGWDYINANPSRNDSSVTGWNVMALKSAFASGLNVKNGLEGSKAWLDAAWKSANPKWKDFKDPYTDTSVFPYTWNAINDTSEKDHLSFVGACCSVFLGHRDGDPMLSSLLNDMDKRWLDTGAWKNNAYCVYYASLAAFQGGREHWLKWREAYVPYLIQSQWKDDDGACLAGTWNYTPQRFPGADSSRVLIHCYYTLSLEVAIRYDVVNKK